MKNTIIIFGIFYLLVLYTMNSLATTKTWIGTYNTDWADGTNWGGTAPVLNDNINIPTVLSGIYPVITKPVFLGNGTISINSNSGSEVSLTISSGGSLITKGLITISGNGKFVMNGEYATINGITSSGSIDVQGGLITSSGYITLNSGTFTQSGGTIHMAASTESNPTENLVFNGGTLTQSGGTFVVKDFKPSAGVFNQIGSTAVLKIFRDWGPTYEHTFNSIKGIVQFYSSTGNSSTFISPNTKFNDIIIEASVDPGFSNEINSIVKVSGNFTNNNSALSNSKNVTFNFFGPENQTITSKSTNIFNKLEIEKSKGNVILASNITVTGTLTMTSGNIETGAYLLTLGASSANQGTLIYTSGIINTGSSGGFKRWFTNASASNILFPVGTSVSNNIIVLSFTSAPLTGGALISKFVALNPEVNSSIPIYDASYSIESYSAIGYWQIDAVNGLSSGTYKLSLRGHDINPTGTDIAKYPHLRILKKSASDNNWTYMFIYSKNNNK